MLKYLFLLNIFFILNCVQPVLPSELPKSNTVDAKQIQLSPYTQVYTNESKKNEDFTVLRVFSVPQSFPQNHPKIFEGIQKAFQKWVDAVDILEIGLSISPVPGGVPIMVGELTEGPFYASPTTLGYFDPIKRHIVIDDDITTTQAPYVLVKLLMHEMGHVFGLPHIIGRDLSVMPNVYRFIQDKAIILKTDEEAQKKLMFPYIKTRRFGVDPEVDESYEISELEVSLARGYLLAHMLAN